MNSPVGAFTWVLLKRQTPLPQCMDKEVCGRSSFRLPPLLRGMKEVLSMVATEKAWEKLSPEQFESLVFALLNREGYMNGEWYGRPKEYVQDIVCYRFTIDGPPELFQKYVAMCKHDKESLTKYRLNKDLEQIRKHSPYCVIVAAILEVSDYKKKVIKDLEKNDENTFQILLWEKPELLKMVEEHQDLRWHFLGVEIDDLHKLPGIRNVLARCNIERISDELCDLLIRTY